MKIIKVGDMNRLNTMHRFECERCGCVWEADASEYRIESDYRNGRYYVCKCPTCMRETIMHPEEEKHG